MIPYIEDSDIAIGLFRFKLSVILVVSAIIVGHLLLIRRAKKRDFDTALVAEFSAMMLVGGLIGGHLVKLFYIEHAWEILRREPKLLLQLLNGQASFGGLAGALVAGLIYLRLRRFDRMRTLELFDCIAQVFPFAWILGRLHCVLVHDHPGVRTTNWLGVRYPDAVRWDLAVLEILFLILLLSAFHFLARRSRAPGFYLAVFLGSYGAFRFGLDQLHLEVVRYLWLSVDQWAALVCLCMCLLLLSQLHRPNSSTRPKLSGLSFWIRRPIGS
jgi:phosphatidylglycerol:prolipoprotein diacylglycerol transferase